MAQVTVYLPDELLETYRAVLPSDDRPKLSRLLREQVQREVDRAKSDPPEESVQVQGD